MTSNELKHQVKVRKWNLSIQDCRSSGLSVHECCRQCGVTPTTYYRWKREVLFGIRRKGGVGSSGGAFVELPAPQLLRNVSERTTLLSIDLWKGIDGLATTVQQQLQLDLFTNMLFLFCGRRWERIKELYWEKNDFILLYK